MTTPMMTTPPAVQDGLHADPQLLAALMTACRLSTYCLTKEQSYLRTNADADTFGDAWDAYLDLLSSRLGHPGLLIRPGKWGKPQYKALVNAGLFDVSVDCLRCYGVQARTGEGAEFEYATLALSHRLWEVCPQ